MPRTCKIKISEPLHSLKYLDFVAEPAENACEFIASKTEFLGIWGEFDEEIDDSFDWKSWAHWKELIDAIFNPEEPWFILVVHVIVIVFSFIAGLIYNKFRIRQLLIQKKEWQDKERLLMQQLWAALEEKLESKKDNEDLSLKLNEIKGSILIVEIL